MTDFVISEEQIEQFGDYVEDDDNRSEEKYKNARSLAAKIRSRPLSDELKKERERLYKLLEEFTWLRYSENRICEKGMDEHCEIRSEIKRLECNGGEP